MNKTKSRPNVHNTQTSWVIEESNVTFDVTVSHGGKYFDVAFSMLEERIVEQETESGKRWRSAWIWFVYSERTVNFRSDNLGSSQGIVSGNNWETTFTCPLLLLKREPMSSSSPHYRKTVGMLTIPFLIGTWPRKFWQDISKFFFASFHVIFVMFLWRKHIDLVCPWAVASWKYGDKYTCTVSGK